MDNSPNDLRVAISRSSMDSKSISLSKSADILQFPNHEIRNFLQAEDGEKLGTGH